MSANSKKRYISEKTTRNDFKNKQTRGTSPRRAAASHGRRFHGRLRRHAQRLELHGRSCLLTVGSEESAVIDNDSGTTCAPVE